MKKLYLLFLLTYNNLCISEQHISHEKADIIIFSFDRPLQLYALLESLEQYVTDINSITTIYRTSNNRYKDAFHQVELQFPQTQFLHQQSIHDFKTFTIQSIENTSSKYVIFAVDDNIVKDFTSLSECISLLEQTNAYGFYLKMGIHLDYCYTENCPQKLPPLKYINKNIFSWKFELGEKDWGYPNTIDMTLYRKNDVLSILKSLNYTNPNLLEGNWAAWAAINKTPSPLGLFYENSKIINIPLNKVQTVHIFNRDMNLYTPQELLEKFEAGLKMDTSPLHQLQNKAVHTEYEPIFISRKLIFDYIKDSL